MVLLFGRLQSKYKLLVNNICISSTSLYFYSVAATLLCISAKDVFAADPQKYKVEIRGTGDATIDKTLSDTSNLITLQKTKAVGAFALSGRVKSDYDRLKTAMDSFGYYNADIHIDVGSVKSIASTDKKKTKKNKKNTEQTVQNETHLNSKIDGNSPNLPSYIERIPAQKDAVIIIRVQKNEQYHIGQIQLKDGDKKSTDMHLTANQEKEFGLKSGQPAVSANIVNAKGKLLTALQEDGHALAKISQPTAYLRPDTKTLDIVYTVTPGPIVSLGDIKFEGLQRMNSDFVRKRLLLHEGQLYQPSAIEAARQDLSGLGVFSSIDVTAAKQTDESGRLPLTMLFKEGKRRTISLEAGYSTDLGGRVGVRWSHHNLFGNAEELKLAALATGLGGTAQRGIGYDVYADFTKPDFLRRNQNLNARVEAVKQQLYSYDQTAFLVKGGITRKINKRWSVSIFLGGIQEKIKQNINAHDKVTNNYTMVNVPLGASYDSTDLSNPLMSPTHGVKASISATPTVSFGDGTAFFAILQGTGSTYFDLANIGLTDPGRSVFAFRGLVGSIQGASRMNLPPDQRMYAGGTASVRGFRFQGVGPQIPGTKYALGGKAMDAGSIEFRQRILSQFGAQAFIDAGQVSDTSMPFEGKLRVGVGGGVKYYTPLGPIRLDIAVPMNRPPRGDKFEVYIGLGETF